jgi:transposase
MALIFLPPYSPELNPVNIYGTAFEKIVSAIKHSTALRL